MQPASWFCHSRFWREGKKEFEDGCRPLQVLGLSPADSEQGSRLRREMWRQQRPAILLLMGHQLYVSPFRVVLVWASFSTWPRLNKVRKAGSSEGRFVVIVTKETSSLVFMCSALGLAESLRLRRYHRMAWERRRDENSQTCKYGSCLRICWSFSHCLWFPVALKRRSLSASNNLKSGQEHVVLLNLHDHMHTLSRHREERPLWRGRRSLKPWVHFEKIISVWKGPL